MSAVKFVAIGFSITIVGAAVFLLDQNEPKSSRHQSHTVSPAGAPRSVVNASESLRGEPRQAQELADLRHQVRQLAEVDERVEQLASKSASTPDPETPPEPMTPEESADHVAAVADFFEGHLADESYDSSATALANSHIVTALAEVENGGRLLGIDCGETLCRSQLGFDDLSQRDARLQDLGSLMPWDADGFFRTDPDDALRVAVYFTREGKALPTLDDAS